MSQDIIVPDREELVLLLCEAAEFEHAVMCTYLFAQWSLKQRTDEGVTDDELKSIDRWRASFRQVALEEMLHLTLVNNILASIGASPHLWRPAFPVRPGHFPANVVMQLRRFDAATLEHFKFIERPENSGLPDSTAFAHPERYARRLRRDLLSPVAQDYESQGHLYHSIINGLTALSDRFGEARLFVGHGDAQVTSAEFGLPGLMRVNDLASARRAIDEIVAQGEGAPAHRENSHFARFAAIADELAVLQKARPDFDPARPVADNPRLNKPLNGDEVSIIEDKQTAKLVDFGNAIYALTMRVFAQISSPSPFQSSQRVGLSIAASELMMLMRVVGNVTAQSPIGPTRPGQTAGLTFGLPISSGQLVQSCASQILSERTDELRDTAVRLSQFFPLPNVVEQLSVISVRFKRLDQQTTSAPVVVVPFAQTQVPIADGNFVPSYDPKRCIHARHCVLDAPNLFGGKTQGPRLNPKTHSADYIARVAENCPSGAITYTHTDGSAAELPPAVNIFRVRENGPYAVRADMQIEGVGPVLRATLCRCGRSANKPFCDNSHINGGFVASGEPETIPSDALDVRSGPIAVAPLLDGPLQINGNVEVTCGTGRTIFRGQSARLCRCGGSATKPICDGSHQTNGFRSGGPASA